MITKLARAIWTDYMPKLQGLGQKIAEHDKKMYALGAQSREAFNDLFLAVGVFKEEQFQIFREMVAIYEDVVKCLEDVDKGLEVYESTGLTRAIGNPEHRANVQKYFALMQE